ncbi:DUF72 domain-containing protein [Derxia lacustris]|uniref:DUF72 domain-containing protein n=1 Tax=Derxia lacustris TaxID=764842 RepID=UPI000A16E2A2|nr:DUF72 domain-containing protein [Derxia lacustris]
MNAASLLVGTASWAAPGLIATGRFYPPGCDSAEARLAHYASVFPLVEVDASWYALPTPARTERWRDRTPAGFIFNFKAFRLFTGHATAPEALPADLRAELGAAPGTRLGYRDVPAAIRAELWRRQALALAPLAAAGKLGALLFQFGPQLHGDARGRAHVQHCLQSLHEHWPTAAPPATVQPGLFDAPPAAPAGAAPIPPMAVEFRDRSWFADGRSAAATLDFERELGLVNVVVDGPQGHRNTVPAVWEVTRPELAMLRLHGRNEAAWANTAAASSGARFDYRYSPAELAELADRARLLALDAKRTHVVFNTNREDQGPRNALGFAQALAG